MEEECVEGGARGMRQWTLSGRGRRMSAGQEEGGKCTEWGRGRGRGRSASSRVEEVGLEEGGRWGGEKERRGIGRGEHVSDESEERRG